MLCCWSAAGQDKQFSLRGKVLSHEDNSPLPGAIVKIGAEPRISITDESGDFVVESPIGTNRIQISYLGMTAYDSVITLPFEGLLIIRLLAEHTSLEEVTVVSTGYQQLPAERVTGSFSVLDQELISRRVSTSLVDRLEDVTPGLLFNRGPQTGKDQLSIRGRSTLVAETQPLIIVDNFPYDGPMESINPNDVEQITVLKDAAAASIWGARAGNGVIVITTKSGSKSKVPKVTLNSNFNRSEQRNLFYVPQMNMGEFVDIQRSLFESNYYRSQELHPSKNALPEAVEILIAQRDGLLTPAQADAELGALKSNDLRYDLSRYYYRPTISQQHSLSVSGGTDTYSYQFGLGYDHNEQAINGNRDERWTLQGKQNWNLIQNRLRWSVNLYLSSSRNLTQTKVPQSSPYSRLIDPQGAFAPIFTNLSSRYISSLDHPGLLDWNNIPLNEIGLLDYRNETLDARFQTGLDIKIVEGFDAEISYQYWTNSGRHKERNPLNSYFARDLINRFTQVSDQGLLQKSIPEGDILDLNQSHAYSHTLRAMLNYRRKWGNDHQLTVLVGSEVRDLQAESNGIRYYGYNDQLGASAAVDYLSRYPMYYNGSLNVTIPQANTHSGLTDRFVSFYGNAGYTFRNKWDLTASVRKDQSNFFGINANNKGVPLWSAGLGWILSDEAFMSFMNGAYLKWKLSYGYSGNLDKSISGRMTAAYFNQPTNRYVPNIPAAQISNPPNPNLSWEKVAIFNSGLLFESKSGRISAGAEYFSKRGIDLIGDHEVALSTGFSRIKGNYAETLTNGLDLVLGADWMKNRLKWRTDFFYSKVNDRVVSVGVTQTAGNLINSFYSALPIPVEGRPLFSVYSYPWAGLNPDNGNPRGWLDGEVSEDYNTILGTATPENLEFHGSGRPTNFGALRNTVSWNGLSLSVNVSYRFGYYYRRTSIDYFVLMRGTIGHGDYDSRWISPGDELSTRVPSLPATANSPRHQFYSNSAVLIEKGDHIRLQDIRIAYRFDPNRIQWFPFASAEIYGYANNLGIIWKASDYRLDPDFQLGPPTRNFAVGIRVDF